MTNEGPNTTPSPAPQRPSVGDALKAAATGRAGPWAGVVLAIVMAVAGQMQSTQASDDTARASYEALRAASEANTAAIEALRKGQAEQAVWVKELSSRLERKQAAQAAAATPRPKPKPVPVEPPAPPAPAPPPPPAPVRLLPFDALAKAAP